MRDVITYNIPNAENGLNYSPPDLDLFDDASPGMEYSNADGYGFWVSKKKAASMKASGKTPMFGHGVGQMFKQLWARAKQFNPLFIAFRGAYLGILKLNAWDMATKMANMEKLAKTNKKVADGWNKILIHWVKFGGDKNILLHNIELGKKRKPLLVRTNKRIKLKFDGDYSYIGSAQVTGIVATGAAATVAGASTAAGAAILGSATGATEAVAGGIVASTPIWAPIVKILLDNKDQVGDLAMHPDDQSAAIAQANALANKEDPNDAINAQKELLRQEDIEAGGTGDGSALKKESNDSGKIMGINKNVVYIGGAMIIVGIILTAILTHKSSNK